MVIHQHIQTCENRLAMMVPETAETGLFYVSQMKKFDEALYLMPQYVYQFVRVPVARLGFLYGIHKLQAPSCAPDFSNIHEFLRDLFIRAQLSAECSIGQFYILCDRFHLLLCVVLLYSVSYLY